MPSRVAVKPELLKWARVRAGIDVDQLARNRKFSKYREWENGEVQPTLKQLEDFAKKTHAPIGYFFLPEPPEESIPIDDFRTIGGSSLGGEASPDLLDTLDLCQERQEWYRDHLLAEGGSRLSFVDSVTLDDDIESVAEHIRSTLGFDLEERAALQNWTDALRCFITQANEVGVLVMVNGVVGNNPHRKLDPEEFRGFALVDNIAPLIFINGADTKAAQMFTLAHELAHIWLGQTALSDSRPNSMPSNRTESWCNKVAAELLVPLAVLHEEYRKSRELSGELTRLARRFKVSKLVVLRRIFDARGLNREQFQEAYRTELGKLRKFSASGGGNFYATEITRVGERFARAIIASTLEGRTLYRDAFHLLGFSKLDTFKNLADRLNVN